MLLLTRNLFTTEWSSSHSWEKLGRSRRIKGRKGGVKFRENKGLICMLLWIVWKCDHHCLLQTVGYNYSMLSWVTSNSCKGHSLSTQFINTLAFACRNTNILPFLGIKLMISVSCTNPVSIENESTKYNCCWIYITCLYIMVCMTSEARKQGIV